MKLWHDDVRMPPDNTWNAWTRTNEEAVLTLLLWSRNGSPCTEASFDLGCHDIGDSPDGDGADLVWAMYYLWIIPPKCTVHSCNPGDAAMMAALLREGGAVVTVKPYAH